MNATTAIELANRFLVINFERMNQGSGWAYDCREYINDDYSFQEICDRDFDGDMDRCLDIFFRRTMLTQLWFSDWQFDNGHFAGYQNPLDDLGYVTEIFNYYINECSIEELKEILGLNIILK